MISRAAAPWPAPIAPMDAEFTQWASDLAHIVADGGGYAQYPVAPGVCGLEGWPPIKLEGIRTLGRSEVPQPWLFAEVPVSVRGRRDPDPEMLALPRAEIQHSAYIPYTVPTFEIALITPPRPREAPCLFYQPLRIEELIAVSPRAHPILGYEPVPCVIRHNEVSLVPLDAVPEEPDHVLDVWGRLEPPIVSETLAVDPSVPLVQFEGLRADYALRLRTLQMNSDLVLRDLMAPAPVVRDCIVYPRPATSPLPLYSVSEALATLSSSEPQLCFTCPGKEPKAAVSERLFDVKPREPTRAGTPKRPAEPPDLGGRCVLINYGLLRDYHLIDGLRGTGLGLVERDFGSDALQLIAIDATTLLVVVDLCRVVGLAAIPAGFDSVHVLVLMQGQEFSKAVLSKVTQLSAQCRVTFLQTRADLLAHLGTLVLRRPPLYLEESLSAHERLLVAVDPGRNHIAAQQLLASVPSLQRALAGDARP